MGESLSSTAGRTVVLVGAILILVLEFQIDGLTDSAQFDAIWRTHCTVSDWLRLHPLPPAPENHKERHSILNP